MAGLILSLIVGTALGLFFFGGLWWTVRKAITSTNPALWFFGSVMLRMAVVMSGFYLVMAGDWRRLCIALVGFIIARMLVTHFSPSPQENSHAP
jgi:F1F0 ATPase subunit 2